MPAQLSRRGNLVQIGAIGLPGMKRVSAKDEQHTLSFPSLSGGRSSAANQPRLPIMRI